MENCISKISKDRLLALGEFMKNKTSFEKRKTRPGLDILSGETNTRIHSIKELSRKKRMLYDKLVCGGGTFFKNELTPKDILCCPKWGGTVPLTQQQQCNSLDAGHKNNEKKLIKNDCFGGQAAIKAI